MMFIDVAKIFIKGGDGGNGAVAFRKEIYQPAGGPAGGDGGNGGSVILKVDEGIRTLMDFRYKRKYKAEAGENGMGKNRFGKKGQDLILKVPPGTIVKDEESGLIIVDLTENEQEYVIAKGGRGGRGNSKFTTSTRQAPSFAEPGGKAEELTIVLELKLLADIGLIGFPNVGKSTILSMVTDAKPKIANYHFTTLKPNLGVVELSDSRSYVIADIPGLIEGAHAGVGLGHEFLRHVERTRLLLHVIDVSGQEGREPLEDFYKINEELKKYNDRLSNLKQIIVANKMDIPESHENVKKLREILSNEYEIFEISAATGEGIKKLKNIVWDRLQKVEDIEPLYDETMKYYKHEDSKRHEVTIRKEDNKYIVEGYSIEKLVNSTNFDDSDSFRYFQKIIGQKNIIERLKEMGIKDGETVDMCGFEFEFLH